MKFTLAEIRWMQRGLTAITQAQLPIRVSYRLSKLLNFCNQEMANVEKVREEMIKTMGEENPDKPGEIVIGPENADKFREEFAQLLQEEVDIDFTPVRLADLGDDLKIAPVELASLSRIIEEE